MPDTTAEPITLQALIRAELPIAGNNARTDAEADLKQKHCIYIVSFACVSLHEVMK